VYKKLLAKLKKAGVTEAQIEEPVLVLDFPEAVGS
jgi:hypothetical protein